MGQPQTPSGPWWGTPSELSLLSYETRGGRERAAPAMRSLCPRVTWVAQSLGPGWRAEGRTRMEQRDPRRGVPGTPSPRPSSLAPQNPETPHWRAAAEPKRHKFTASRLHHTTVTVMVAPFSLLIGTRASKIMSWGLTNRGSSPSRPGP